MTPVSDVHPAIEQIAILISIRIAALFGHLNEEILAEALRIMKLKRLPHGAGNKASVRPIRR